MKQELKTMLTQAEEKLRAADPLLKGDAWGDAASRAYDVTTDPGGKRWGITRL